MIKSNSQKEIFQELSELVSFIFKGLGQIMLQENMITGGIFLAGIFIGSMTMGLAAILATIVGTLTAKLFKFDKANLEKGIYGFSAALVGTALLLFFKPAFFIWLFVIAGAILASSIQHFFFIKKINVFTLPFVLVTWIFVYAISKFFPELMVNHISEPLTLQNDFAFAIRGFGQVIFQNNMLSGLLFFVAVFISSPIAALYGLAGAIFSATLAVYFSAQAEAINLGLLSYNAVLCAIVFSGHKIIDGIWALAAVLVALFISMLMTKFNLMELTFPFVIATMTTLQLKNVITINQQ